MATRRSAQEGGGETPFRMHGDLLTTTLLAFLRNWNAYGYQLAQQLAEAGLPAFDSGTVYRTLRQLERTGLVSSFWDTSESGPARRMYSLTKAGDLFLSSCIDVLGRYQAVLQKTIEGLSPEPGGDDDDQPQPPRHRARG
ncbi:MAG TPA: helix-turn-helix transcriptional regulator [Dehalococcoidia bacterium]|nr:helix-turn-helix transcriptional regulator [Dehalococcoidia bacterium]